MADSFMYFSYGSNLLTKRIHINNPSAIRIGIGKLTNYRLDFNLQSSRWHGSCATIVPHDGYHVWGAIWEISLEHLPALDKQEGVDMNLYFRFDTDVELPNGSMIKCITYQLNRTPMDFCKLSTLPSSRRPSQVYLNTIINGAKESGVPSDYQIFLETISHNGYNCDVTANLVSNISD